MSRLHSIAFAQIGIAMKEQERLDRLVELLAEEIRNTRRRSKAAQARDPGWARLGSDSPLSAEHLPLGAAGGRVTEIVLAWMQGEPVPGNTQPGGSDGATE